VVRAYVSEPAAANVLLAVGRCRTPKSNAGHSVAGQALERRADALALPGMIASGSYVCVRVG